MANDQSAGAEFRPFVVENFKPNKYIQAGGQTTTPYLRGVQDLAYNHNTILANTQHALIVQQQPNASVAITFTGAPTEVIPFAKYIIWVPSIPGRTTIQVQVSGSTTGGAQFQVRGVTATGAGTYSAATTSGNTATFTVPVSMAAYQLLTLDVKLDGNFNFSPAAVYCTYAPFATTTLSGVTADIVPQDVLQYGVDRPLAVAMLRDLIQTNAYLYTKNVRCIQNWSYWGNWTSGVLGSNVGMRGPAASFSSATQKNTVSEIYYVPRQGVQSISVFATGRTDGGGALRGLYFKFKDGNGDWTGTTFPATTVATEGNWAIWNTPIDVPQGTTGPLYLCMAVTPEATSNVRAQALAIYERSAGII